MISESDLLINEERPAPADPLAAALSYAARGWSIIPVNGKAPLTPHGVKDATGDPAVLGDWWAKWPNAAPAVALRASGVAVLDCDSAEAIKEAEALLDGVRCPVAETPSGGQHYIIAADGLPTGRWVHRGASGRLDLLSDGYVVLPPGPSRRWLVSPDDCLPPPPEAVRRLFEEAARESARRRADETDLPLPQDVEALAQQVLSRLPDWVREEWQSIPNEDRSGHCFHLARRLVELGVTDPVEVAAVVYTSAAHRDKFRVRPDGWLDSVRAAQRALDGETPTAEAVADREYRIVTLADVQPRETAYLWPPYVPLEELTLCDGDSGEGKTWVALWLAARTSRGEAPVTGGAGRVLLLTVEDALDRVIVPRLLSLGADLGLVHAVTCADTEVGVTASDIDRVAPLIREISPRLLIVDTISQFFDAAGSGAFYQAPVVRRTMQPLRDMVRELGCAAWLNRHTGKAPREARHRGLGSVDFMAIARSALYIGQAQGQSAMAHTKNNLGPLGPTLAFQVVEGAEPPFAWTGETALTADDLACPPPPPQVEVLDSDEAHAVEDAMDVLRQMLADGPVPATQALAQARRDLAISERTVKTAKARLGVRSQKKGDRWYWLLPTE